MDSRLLYNAAEHLKHNVNWIKPSETEWIYCGSAGEVKLDIIKSEVSTFFESDRLYIVTTRNNSYEVPEAALLDSIKDKVGVIDMYVWNDNFSKVIEFNKIGVFRKGIAAANISLPKVGLK